MSSNMLGKLENQFNTVEVVQNFHYDLNKSKTYIFAFSSKGTKPEIIRCNHSPVNWHNCESENGQKPLELAKLYSAC